MKRKAIVRHDITTTSGPHRVEQHVDLDEVIIPGVLHAEHMGDGVWCIIFGDHDLHVSASKRGVTIVEASPRVCGVAVVGGTDGMISMHIEPKNIDPGGPLFPVAS